MARAAPAILRSGLATIEFPRGPATHEPPAHRRRHRRPSPGNAHGRDQDRRPGRIPRLRGRTHTRSRRLSPRRSAGPSRSRRRPDDFRACCTGGGRRGRRFGGSGTRGGFAHGGDRHCRGGDACFHRRPRCRRRAQQRRDRHPRLPGCLPGRRGAGGTGAGLDCLRLYGRRRVDDGYRAADRRVRGGGGRDLPLAVERPAGHP
jgi:hypothetical protein